LEENIVFYRCIIYINVYFVQSYDKSLLCTVEQAHYAVSLTLEDANGSAYQRANGGAFQGACPGANGSTLQGANGGAFQGAYGCYFVTSAVPPYKETNLILSWCLGSCHPRLMSSFPFVSKVFFFSFLN
jgi:hypothetical protein